MKNIEDWEKKNPAPKCTCGEEEKWKPKDEHEEKCMLLQPNFLYKSTGFSLEWYKYPLRDSYMNQEITLKDFKKIIDKCIQSVK